MELLSLNHITKIYGVTRALDDVSISFEKGEVHALIGENGAGKSTFIKTLSGAIRPTEGTITIEGVTYNHLEPNQAINLGIAVVYQELIQFEAMSVADNIFLGVKDEEGLFLNDKQRVEKAKEVLKVFDCDIDPKKLVRELSIANRQIVELAKALVRNAKVVVMDEPTAAITLAEQEKLYTVVKDLRSRGITVIYISHRLEELFVLCDRVSVLRDGHYITTKHISEMTQQDMIKYMVGRELTNTFVEKKPCEKEVVLDLSNVTGNGVKNISLQLHKGEILGFGGLVGAGRTELMNVIYGAARKEAGVITLNGKEVDFKSPTEGMKAGIGLIPEDRKQLGCFLDKPIYWNNSISALDKICNAKVFIDGNKERDLARGYREKLKLKAASLKHNASSLSGGNQQKVVIAKALAALPDILIFDEPTRGIDVGARYEIYLLMAQLCEAGKSILMVSSDMGELIGMSERIIILHEGEFAGELTDKSDFNEETILGIASGMDLENARAAAQKK